MEALKLEYVDLEKNVTIQLTNIHSVVVYEWFCVIATCKCTDEPKFYAIALKNGATVAYSLFDNLHYLVNSWLQKRTTVGTLLPSLTSIDKYGHKALQFTLDMHQPCCDLVWMDGQIRVCLEAAMAATHIVKDKFSISARTGRPELMHNRRPMNYRMYPPVGIRPSLMVPIDEIQRITDKGALLARKHLKTEGEAGRRLESPTSLTGSYYKIINQPEIPTEQPEIPTEQPEIPTEQPEIPTEQPEIPTELPEIPTELPEIPTEQPKIPTEQPEIPTEQPENYQAETILELHPVQPKIPTEQPEIPTEQQEIPTEQPEIPTEQPENYKAETILVELHPVQPVIPTEQTTEDNGKPEDELFSEETEENFSVLKRCGSVRKLIANFETKKKERNCLKALDLKQCEKRFTLMANDPTPQVKEHVPQANDPTPQMIPVELGLQDLQTPDSGIGTANSPVCEALPMVCIEEVLLPSTTKPNPLVVKYRKKTEYHDDTD